MRPKDYGDKYPSDIGDVAPADPTAGFTEVDYKLPRVKPTPKIQPLPGTFDPDFKIPQPFATPRHTFVGRIISYVGLSTDGFPQYSIFLQDGKIITAKLWSKVDAEYFDPGQAVIVVTGQAANEYICVGQLKHDDPSEIIWVQLTGILHPGAQAAANPLVFQNGVWVASSEIVTINDPNYCNFGLVGEVFQAVVMRGTSNQVECCGSQGLYRKGKTEAAITAGSAGDINIWTGADTGTVVSAVGWMNSDVGADVPVFVFFDYVIGTWHFIAAIASDGTEGKVKVKSSDALAYLESQFSNYQPVGTYYSSSGDVLVEFETVTVSGDSKVRGFFNRDGVNDHKVKVNVTEATADYLGAQIVAVTPLKKVITANDTVDISFDHTTIAGYSASGTRILGIVAGVLTFLETEPCTP